ncbi:serine protease HTRA1B-like [Oppia nitens]|uniref:serine protease HTRA1B-like n=1 Tax=Oppia nitens TaxID=1686743 RepID=UPI0023D9EEC0|nr:serine protease HTRA1B-like [Oppia nitens]
MSYQWFRFCELGVTVFAGSVYHRYQHRERRQHLTIQCTKQLTVSLRCAHQMDEEIAPVVRKCRPFLVSVVRSTMTHPKAVFSHSSGFIVDNKLGLIVSNNHVAEGIDTLRLSLYNNTLRYCDVFVGADQNQGIINEISGKIVYSSPDCDLALIQLPPIKPDVLPVCQFSTDWAPGDHIIAISGSRGRFFAADGFILKLDKYKNITQKHSRDIGDKCDILIHTGYIVAGYSGGPVVNMDGQVVGVHKSSRRGFSCYALSIAAKTVIDFIEKGKQYLLTENVEVMKLMGAKHRRFIKRRTLGIVLMNNQIIDITFAPNIIRQNLLVNDQIVSYNNIEFTTPDEMSSYVQQLPNYIDIVLIVHRSTIGQSFNIIVQPVTVEQFEF